MNTYNSFNVMLDNKNTAANYTIAAVLTMYKIFLQVFMYVSRISPFGCSLHHAGLLRHRSLCPVPCSPQKRSCKVGNHPSGRCARSYTSESADPEISPVCAAG